MADITVTGPDGSRYTFPANTPPATIQSVMRQRFGGPEYVQPAPPPGEVIHDVGGRSYVSDRPEIAVDRSGMSPEGAARATAALRQRADRGNNGVPAFARALMPAFQGVTMSAGDELVSGVAGARSFLSGDGFQPGFDYAQEVQRQELARERAENPVRSAVGQIGGAIGTGVALAPLMPAAALGQGPLATQMAAGAGVGAAGGAVEGFMAGSGVEDRLANAGHGAALGAAVGTAAPVFFGAVREGGRRVMDAATTDRQIGRLGLTRPSADMVRRPLEADMAAGGAQRITRAGPDAMIADAGTATRGVVDTAIQRGGPSSTPVLRAVDARVENAMGSLRQQMDAALGSPRGILQTEEGIRAGTAGARRSAYDAAYSAPIDYASPAGRALESLQPRVTGDVLNEANTLMRLMGHQSRQILADVAPDGTVSFRTMPDVLQWDFIKRGLESRARALDGQGAMGGQTPMGRALNDVAGDIRNALGDAVPAYRTALDTAREPIQQIQALRLGYDALKPGTTRSEFVSEMARQGPANRAAVRAGMREYIDDVLSNVRVAATNADVESLPELRRAVMDLSTPAAKAKLRLVLTPEQFDTFDAQLDQAMRALVLKADVATNSRTFGRQAARDAADQASTPGMAGEAMRGRPLNAVQRAVQTFFGTRPQDDLARQDDMYDGALRFIMEPRGPQGSGRAVNALLDAYRVGTRNELLADRAARDLTTGGALGVYQGGQLLLGDR